MKTFEENRPYIQNGFEEAVFDPSTGMDAKSLYEKLVEIKKNLFDRPPQTIYATTFAYCLDHVQLEINEHTPFSVKYNFGIDYSYFAS